MTSLYTLLGVSADASPEQIDAAYAQLISRLEPGAGANGRAALQARLMAAREAHAILSDPAARQRYNMKRLYAILGVPTDALPEQADAACARLIVRLEAESAAAAPEVPAIAVDPVVRPQAARKSLYALLGVEPDASAEQINDAYARLVERIKASSEEDQQARLVAAREAYSILSDPPGRERYDIKLRSDLARAERMPASPQAAREAPAPGESAGGYGFLVILLIGAVALGGLYMYSNSVRERDKLRIEHEKEIQMRALKLLEEEQSRKAAEAEAKQDLREARDIDRNVERERSANERYLRDLDQRHRSELREEEQRKQRESYEQERKAREAERQQQRELAEARYRAERDKAEAERIERERRRRYY